MHILPLHISDFFQATARFSPEQKGVYLDLLLEYYKTEKPLPAALEDLEFLCGISTPKHKAALRFVLKRCFLFDETANVYRQKRADEEIEKYRVSCIQTRYAILCRHWPAVNKEHAKPTYEQFAENPSRYFDDATRRVRIVTGRNPLVLEPYGDGSTGDPAPEYVPVSDIQNPVSNSTPVVHKGTPTIEGVAEAIYALYPRKEGRKKALVAIVKALKSGRVTELELQAKVREYAACVAEWSEQDRANFVPHPATWFNQERWMDDPAFWRKDTANSTPGGFGRQKNGGGAAVAPLTEDDILLGAGQALAEPEGWRLILVGQYAATCPEEWADVPRNLQLELIDLAEQAKNRGGAL
jgi:uncharacterized protein YdaU (DUF1376 family)